MRDTYVRVMGFENLQGFTAFVSSNRTLAAKAQRCLFALHG